MRSMIQCEVSRVAQGDAIASRGSLARLVKDSAGVRQRVESVRRAKQCWWTANGKLTLAVRYGARTIDLAKGKNAVEVGTEPEILTVLNTIKNEVEAGELDSQLESVGHAVKQGFQKF